MTTYESNELLFIFMGGKIRNGIVQRNAKHYPSSIRGYSAKGFILYHKSWECLMPVVEDIERRYKVSTTITTEYVMIGSIIVKVHSDTKLEATYTAIIHFLMKEEYDRDGASAIR